ERRVDLMLAAQPAGEVRRVRRLHEHTATVREVDREAIGGRIPTGPGRITHRHRADRTFDPRVEPFHWSGDSPTFNSTRSAYGLPRLPYDCAPVVKRYHGTLPRSSRRFEPGRALFSFPPSDAVDMLSTVKTAEREIARELRAN